jgi:bla regulator protein BlaR1
MIGALTNHLWHSTLYAGLVWTLAFALRKNRAQVRYWLWFSASLKFFIPFSLLISAGGFIALTPPARKIATHMVAPTFAPAMVQISEPFPVIARRMPAKETTRDWLPVSLFSIWVSGFLAITLMRFRDWLRIQQIVRSSTASGIAAAVPVRCSPGLLEPGVVGLWRPTLLIPEGITEQLTPPQLEAVLAHEMCHVRRRDNLFAAFHMIVEAAFWFHPLVWWIGARLMEERERACDEEVLRMGNDPHTYAEGIVNVCRLYAESPLRCIAGVTGSNIKKRIEVIMANHIGLNLDFARKLALAAAAIAVLAVPIVIGIMNTPLTRAQSASAALPVFKEASIRLCGDEADPAEPVSTPRAAAGSAAVPPPPPRKMGHERSVSPGMLRTGCVPLVAPTDNLGIIQHAYVRFADGSAPRFWPSIIPIEGGPAWIRSELYDISATADGNPGEELMKGPMMQALLADRFKLKMHRETREVPMYALTMAPGGLQLKPFQEGHCLAIPPKATLSAPPKGQKYCEVMVRSRPPAVRGEGSTLTEFSQLLNLVLDRPVIDRTGITGKFDINLEFGIDRMTPRFLPGGDMARFAQAHSNALPIVTAIQQLGLKLEPTNGPREFLVIDHMERPTAAQ